MTPNEREREEYPADAAHPNATSEPDAGEDVVGAESQTQHRRPRQEARSGESPTGRGMASEPHVSRPTTTGTPGGQLGAPTERELKRDPEDESDKQDGRTNT